MVISQLFHTYPYGRKDILKLIDECDQARIVDVDPVHALVVFEIIGTAKSYEYPGCVAIAG